MAMAQRRWSRRKPPPWAVAQRRWSRPVRTIRVGAKGINVRCVAHTLQLVVTSRARKRERDTIVSTLPCRLEIENNTAVYKSGTLGSRKGQGGDRAYVRACCGIVKRLQEIKCGSETQKVEN